MQFKSSHLIFNCDIIFFSVKIWHKIRQQFLLFSPQRFWRNYLNQKQVRSVAVQKDVLVMASAATLLQASWRAHLERQRYLELRTATIIIQQRWKEYYRRRHMAALCIQARWKGYRESKRYQEQRNKIILLQSICRGFRARQR